MTFLNDLRHAWRQAARAPVFAAAAASTVALGVGGATAMFSFVEAIVLRDLPYVDPQALVLVEHVTPSGWEIPSSPANYRRWAERVGEGRSGEGPAPPLAGIAAAAGRSFDLAGEGEPARAAGAIVSASFFPLLGVEPAHGRGFAPEEDHPGAARVALVSDGLWRRRLGGDPGAVGGAVRLNGERYTVAGVLPPGFRPPEALGLGEAEIWVALGPFVDWSEERSHFLAVLARLAPGAAPARAEAALGALTAAAPGGTELLTRVGSLREATLGDVGGRLLVLFGAVGLVLLAASVNAANLLLARAGDRLREAATRVALGAGRGHLLRQHVAEGLLLALLGGVAGTVLAAWLLDLLVALSPADLPRLAEVGIDTAVLAFSLAVSLAAGLALGAVPALATWRQGPGRGLHRAGAAGGAGGGRLRALLVAVEVALALVLVVAAGLLAKNLWRLGRLDPGFEPGGKIAMQVSLHRERRPEPAGQQAFFEALLERAAALPGVEAAAGISELPLSGRNAITTFSVPGVEPAAGEEEPWAGERQVTPGYFALLGVPLLAGRDFTAADRAGAEPVVIVNESLARRFWPGQGAVGKRLDLGRTEARVVGVVGDVRHDRLDGEPPLEIYGPFAQIPRRRMEVVVRAGELTPPFAAALRQAVWSLAPDQPVGELRPVSEVVEASLAPQRFPSLLLGLFAAVALALAAVGIYGVVAYSVSRRRRELGIRLALGAQAGQVLRLVAAQGARPVAAGLASGLLGALLLTRLLDRFLYQVSPTDPATFTAVALFLAAVAALACYLPARRATRIDPAANLRQE